MNQFRYFTLLHYSINLFSINETLNFAVVVIKQSNTYFSTIMVIIYIKDRIFAACMSLTLSDNSVYQNHYDIIDITKTYLLDYEIIISFIKIFKIDSNSYRNLYIFLYSIL